MSTIWPNPLMAGLSDYPLLPPPLALPFTGYPYLPWRSGTGNGSSYGLSERSLAPSALFYPKLLPRSDMNPRQLTDSHLGVHHSFPFAQGLNYSSTGFSVKTLPCMLPLSNDAAIPKTTRGHDLELNNGESPRTISVLDAEVAKINRATQRKSADKVRASSSRSDSRENHNDCASCLHLTPLHKRVHDGTVRIVHSPPTVQNGVLLPSPNAASTPLKAFEQKRLSCSTKTLKNEQTDPKTENIPPTANFSQETRQHEEPLDLRVHKNTAKRVAEEFDPDVQRTPKRRKGEEPNSARRYTCNRQGCQRSFSSKLGLNRHANTHITKTMDAENTSNKNFVEVESTSKPDASVSPSSELGNYATQELSAGTVPLDEDVSKDKCFRKCPSGRKAQSDKFFSQKNEMSSEFSSSGSSETVDSGMVSGSLRESDESTVNSSVSPTVNKTWKHIQHMHSAAHPRHYKCLYPDCNGSFSQEKNLNSHCRHVHGEKPYKCTFEGCDKSYSTKSTLKHHMFVHTDTFKCSWPNCSKRFRDDYNLRTHYMIHTGQKPRKCVLCDYSCVQKNSMDWHMKTKHQDN